MPNGLPHFCSHIWRAAAHADALLQLMPLPCCRCCCWHRLLLSGWQIPERDVSSPTGLSCESVISCSTQHLHEVRWRAVNGRDLPLWGKECVEPYFPQCQLPSPVRVDYVPARHIQSQAVIPIIAHYLISTLYSVFCWVDNISVFFFFF